MPHVNKVKYILIVNTQDAQSNNVRSSDKSTNDDVNEDRVPETYIENNLKVHWDTFSLNLYPFHSCCTDNVDRLGIYEMFEIATERFGVIVL